MHNVPLAIANDLDLDVPVAVHRGLFGKHLFRRTLLDGSGDVAFQVVHISYQSNASASSTINGFDHYRQTVLRRKFPHSFDIASGLRESWQNWNATFFCKDASLKFIASTIEVVRARPNNHDVCIGHLSGKI
jgi:hypothetical protein